MDNKLITICITLVVGVILAGSVLMPVLNDVTTVNDTYTNDGLYHLSKYGVDADITATWDYTEPDIITIGDKTVELPNDTTYLMTVVGNDALMVRYGDFGSGNIGIQVYDNSSNNTKISASMTDEKNLTMTVSNGSIVFNDGTSTVTESYTSVFFISPDGEYVMKTSSDVAYMNGDSEFCGIGRTNVKVGTSSPLTNLYLDGTINDGFTAKGISNAGIGSDDEEINYTVDNSHIDLYKMTGVTFNATYTYSDETYKTPCSYSQIIVPYQVTAERSIHFTSDENALIGAIPIMVIIALVMFAVGGIYLSRKD